MLIELSVDYWSESVVCFDPEKVITKLVEWFPDFEVDPTDRSAAELQRIEKFLASENMSAETRESMLKQAQGKARRNGPVFHCQIALDGLAISVSASRYSVCFDCDCDIPEPHRSRITEFLRLLELGDIAVDCGQ